MPATREPARAQILRSYDLLEKAFITMLLQFVTLAVLSSLSVRSTARPLDSDTAALPFGRIAFKNVADPYVFDRVDFNGDGQTIYVANVIVAGQSFEVQLDTGSADLWLDTRGADLSKAVDTHVLAEINYLDKSFAAGDITIAPAGLGPFTVPAQAFINAPNSNAVTANDRGLLGLGPASSSEIYNKMQGTQYNGSPLLDNIFAAYPNIPNYITFSLARSNLGITDGGIFTIGSVDPQWPTLINQPKMDVHAANAWVVYMDGIKVNGQPHTGGGVLATAPGVSPEIRNKMVTVLDTGTSLGLIPRDYLDAIYGKVPGAIFRPGPVQVIYEVPCDARLDVSMIVDGVEFPFDPLDLTRLVSDPSGNVRCISAFGTQPSLQTHQGIDFLLGDMFLRNVYALFGFGHLTAGRDGDPYVQLLGTTDKNTAWNNFAASNQARIAQWKALGGTFHPPRAAL